MSAFLWFSSLCCELLFSITSEKVAHVQSVAVVELIFEQDKSVIFTVPEWHLP